MNELMPAKQRIAVHMNEPFSQHGPLQQGAIMFEKVFELIPIAILVAFCIWLPWLLIKEFIHQLPSQRKKRRSWYCQTCGYNLKANASGICPECGTPLARRPMGGS